MKNKRKIITVLILVLFGLTGIVIWYVNDYYHSNINPGDYQGGDVLLMDIDQGIFLDGPGDDTAVIFYPGAKVEYTAYLPLLNKLAGAGIDCFLINMPCNLAILGQNIADSVMKEFDYSHWYLSGHSLGGAMAASYASRHLNELDGVILLAGYPIKSLQAEDFNVLSVYGSQDGVLNFEKLEEGRKYMPENYTEISIEGGNHAGFGDYGEQKGDHAAVISREEQQVQTAEAILNMIAPGEQGTPAETIPESYKD